MVTANFFAELFVWFFGKDSKITQLLQLLNKKFLPPWFVTLHFYFVFPAVVAISTIASFNRMKQITDDISLVVKAMKMSSMLEVSLLVLLC